tara:strand:+ start:172 stop:321 length:150 start_codon:yes stop_codon:yes gene_type:complete
MSVKHYDCVYMDRKGNRRAWVTTAHDVQHVIEIFNKIVGEGRIISIHNC